MEENNLTASQVLAFVQNELHVPKNQHNSFGGYNYRSAEDILEAAKPIIKAAGATVVLKDKIKEIGGRVYVKAIAKFIYGDQVIKVCSYAREEDTKKGMDAAQITGSASSYARKYALNGLFLLDDSKDPDSQDNSEMTKDTSKPKTTPKKGSQTPKQRFWAACLATAKKEGADDVKTAATAISESMMFDLGHGPSDEEFTEMAFVLETAL